MGKRAAAEPPPGEEFDDDDVLASDDEELDGTDDDAGGNEDMMPSDLEEGESEEETGTGGDSEEEDGEQPGRGQGRRQQQAPHKLNHAEEDTLLLSGPITDAAVLQLEVSTHAPMPWRCVRPQWLLAQPMQPPLSCSQPMLAQPSAPHAKPFRCLLATAPLPS